MSKLEVKEIAPISGETKVTLGDTLHVDSASGNVGIGRDNPSAELDVQNTIRISEEVAPGSTSQIELFSKFSDGQRGYVILKSESNSTGSSDLVFLSRQNFTEGERMRIASNGRVDITGSLYVNGAPKIGYQELITTLSTIRSATENETTLEGLRDSLGNAIAGLIEEFENQVATMQAEENL